MMITRTCPTHGDFYTKEMWWRHGDDCSDMCIECEPHHTSDVGCQYVNIDSGLEEQ